MSTATLLLSCGRITSLDDEGLPASTLPHSLSTRVHHGTSSPEASSSAVTYTLVSPSLPLENALSNGASSSLSTNETPAIPRTIAVKGSLSEEDLYNLKAEAFYNQGERHRAMAMWAQILRRAPNHLSTVNNLATAYFNERRYMDAEHHYRRVIELDGEPREYPQALYLGPLAHYKQHGALLDSHAAHLREYLNSNEQDHRVEAAKLRLIGSDKIVSKTVNAFMLDRMRDELTKSNRNIIHYWAAWCTPCIRELTDIFQFRSRHPGINYLIISVDPTGDKDRADKRLNDIYSPFKRERKDNIHFLHDAHKEFWNIFVPKRDREIPTVPKTVFLTGTTPVAYIARQISWDTLDVLDIWEE